MKSLLFLLAAGLFVCASCNKEHLPTYYFKCKLDGKEYVPDNCTNCRIADVLGDTLLILGANRNIESMALGGLEYPLRQKSYTLSTKISIGRGTADYDNTIGSPSDIFKTDSVRTGQLNITLLDKSNKIIEGTFFFEAYNQVQNRTVKITEGKFRLKYDTY